MPAGMRVRQLCIGPPKIRNSMPASKSVQRRRSTGFPRQDQVLGSARAKARNSTISKILASLMRLQSQPVRQEFTAEETEWPKAKGDALNLLQTGGSQQRVAFPGGSHLCTRRRFSPSRPSQDPLG